MTDSSRNLSVAKENDNTSTGQSKRTDIVRGINPADIPWIEKYRPATIDELTVDDNLKKRIKKIIDDKNMPNIILAGVPGIGKTSTIRCIARALLGRHINEYMLELNASDDRGIKAVQDRITNFCKKMMHLNDNDESIYPHKIILLDEADNMTKKAQQLISGLMEDYNHNTRFAFTCNNSSDIVESIQSQCTLLRYKRLTTEELTKNMLRICDAENIKYTEEGLDTIMHVCCGDMRQAINNLQLIHNSYGKVTYENVYRICDKPSIREIQELLTLCEKRDITGIIRILDTLLSEGYSSSDIIFEIINVIKLESTKLDEGIKMLFLKELSQSSVIMNRGFDNEIQLYGCVLRLVSLY